MRVAGADRHDVAQTRDDRRHRAGQLGGLRVGDTELAEGVTAEGEHRAVSLEEQRVPPARGDRGRGADDPESVGVNRADVVSLTDLAVIVAAAAEHRAVIEQEQ